MSEGFLSRWSRRKREADEPAADATPATSEVSRERAIHDSEAPAPLPEDAKPAPVDLSQLPPIESIDAGTDIRAFLARGIPAELTRAALRRAWSADPAIRDFIGLSENAWDFNAPDGVPGFAPTLPAEDVKRLLAQAMGNDEKEPQPRSESEAAPQTASQSEKETLPGPKPQADSGEQPQLAEAKTAPLQSIAETASPERDVAVQDEAKSSDNTILPARHLHGRALPE